MKAKPRIAGDNWELDGSTIIVRIPMTWKRLGGRKAVIAPDGSAAWAPAKPRPDETLIRALARAHRWKGMLEDAAYRSAAEMAEAEKVTRSFVTRLLAPDPACPRHRRSHPRRPSAEGDAAGGHDTSNHKRVGGPETASR